MLSCCLWWHCLVFFLWLCRGKVDVETSQSRVSKAFLEFSLKKTSPGRWSGLTQPHIPGRYSRYCRYPSLILPCSANRHIFENMEYILTNIFDFVVRLFSNGLQMDSKYGMNKNVAHRVHLHVSPMFSSRFDVFCDLCTLENHGNMESICFIQ